MKSKHLEIPCGGGYYVSPCSKVVEIQPEGVLCGSGQGEFSTPAWELEKEDPLDW